MPFSSRVGVGARLAAFAGAGAYAVWSRTSALDQSLWKDETHSVVDFISGGPRAIFGDGYSINNHILFNLLAWLTTAVSGRTETWLRVWAALPGLAAVAILGLGLRRRFDTAVALSASFVMLVSPTHTVLTKQARGYGLAYLAASIVTLAAIDFVRLPDEHSRRRSSRMLIVGGLIGTLSFVLFVLPFGFLVVVLAAGRDRERRRAGLQSLVIVALVTAGAYARGLGQLLESSGDFRHHRYLERASITLLWTWPHDLLGAAFRVASERVDGLPAPWTETIGVWGLAAPALAIGTIALLRGSQARLLAALLVPMVATLGTFAALRMAIADRYWAWSIVPVATLLGLGVSVAARWIRSRAPVPIQAGIAVGAGLLAATLVIGHARFTTFRNENPVENYKAAGETVAAWEREHGRIDLYVVTRVTVGAEYYVRQPDAFVASVGVARAAGVAVDDLLPRRKPIPLSRDDLWELLCSTERSVALVLHGDDDDAIDLAPVVAAGGTTATFPQIERGGSIVVAILPAASDRTRVACDPSDLPAPEEVLRT